MIPESQRKVIEMSRFLSMSNKEIADKLGLSEQTVKNRLVMGMKSLRRLFGNSVIVTGVVGTFDSFLNI